LTLAGQKIFNLLALSRLDHGQQKVKFILQRTALVLFAALYKSIGSVGPFMFLFDTETVRLVLAA
jgi:hypothetical protein